MPRRSTPTLDGQALAALRSAREVARAGLAERAGSPAAGLAGFESGRGPIRAELDRLAMALRPARAALDPVRTPVPRETVATWARQERAAAAELWERLLPLTARERRARIAADPVYHSWGLAELLCAASEKAAPADAGQALALADLALLTAGHVHESAAWRSRVQGYCWAFVGNARRVAGRLVLADLAFEESEKHWQAGAPADPGRIFDEGRLFDLKASLRCAQRRFDEALQLHQSALEVTPPARRGSILLNLSRVQFEVQDYAGALDSLEQAATLIDPATEKRLYFGLRFNTAGVLCRLDRHREAEALLQEVRRLAAALGNPLDLTRVLWLTGWVAAGLGRTGDAVAALEQVRTAFARRAIDYDFALVSLDLAALYLEQRQTDRVKQLAAEMAPVFRREQVHREGLAALRLVCEAAFEETDTAGLVTRVLRYLEQARHEPDRPFEG